MAVRAEQQKQAVIEAATDIAITRLGASRAAMVQRFLIQFYDHVSPADLADRAPEDLYGAAVSLWQFAQTRMPGRAKLRVFNPRAAEQGWSSHETVIEIVNDDMPFLVDSVSMALNAEGVTVHLVIHPVMRVERDSGGQIARLGESDQKAGRAESLMHVEISEVRDQARLGAIAKRLEGVLEETRAAVEDWRNMRAKLGDLQQELTHRKPPIDDSEVAETLEFLAWLDDDNFTYLGCREYRFNQAADASIAPGLGILRDPFSTDFAIFPRFRPMCRPSCARRGFCSSPNPTVVPRYTARYAWTPSA
jgi:glutamate dehydrogenase